MYDSMTGAVMRRIAALAALIGLAIAAPASAQFRSEGYEFLKAVKERDGNAATQALNEPGTTIVNARDISSGETALHIVTARRDAIWIRFLTQRGGNPNIRDKKGVSPLQIAVRLGFVEGVEALLKAGAEIEVRDSAGETPLIAAVHSRDISIVRLLLEKGANPDGTDNSGRTAREYAELSSGNSLLLDEFKAADAKRAAEGEQRNYGPSL